jgi:site-specific DNA-cytosine methylase
MVRALWHQADDESRRARGFDGEAGVKFLSVCSGIEAASCALAPRECERLQGFRDDWTLVPVKKVSRKRLRSPKVNTDGERRYVEIDGEVWQLASDGPRYKQLGNSMAVPVIAWIGRRILADAARSS